MTIFNTESPQRFSNEEMKEQANQVFEKFYSDLIREDETVDMDELKMVLRHLYILIHRHGNLVSAVTGDGLTKSGTYTKWVTDLVDRNKKQQLLDNYNEMYQAVIESETELTFDDVKAYFGVIE